MKNIRTRSLLAGAALLCLACTSPASGDDTAPTPKEKAFNGNVTSVDLKERVMSVKAFWGTKTFNLPDNCKVSLEDQPTASLGDLRPGQEVEVHYGNNHGVPIATRIAQKNIVFAGHIAAIDPARKTVTVKHGPRKHDFVLAQNYNVVVQDDKAGSLSDLKVGHTVNVIYEFDHGSRIARRIEQTQATFVGTIQAIDAGTRTVRAKRLLSEKKFHLADDCRIVVDGKGNGRLNDLRIGERVVFSYEDANGVLVASRLGTEATESKTETAQAGKPGNAVP